MSRKLTDLIDWDSKSRWRIMILSMMFAAGCGFIAESSGCSFLMSQIIAGFAGISFGIGMTMRYIRNPSRISAKKAVLLNSTSQDLRRVLRPLIATLSVFFILLILSPQIKAMVLSVRLRSVLSAKQSPIVAAKADHILRLAEKSHTKLRPELVSVASAEASRLDDPRVWSDYISSVNNEVRLRSPNPTGPIHQGDRLDGFNLIDGVIADQTVFYDGGRVSLKNICFYNVHFNIVDNINGRELANAILSSKNNCVTISLP